MSVMRASVLLAWVVVPLCAMLAATPAFADEAEEKAGTKIEAEPKPGDDKPADGEHKKPADGEHGAEHKTASHGNDFDLGHANAGPAQGSPEEFKGDLSIYTFVVFLLLLAILGKFAWRPIMSGLEKREQSIAHMIDEAKENQHKTQEALKQYEAKLAAATEETRLMLAQARQDAEVAKEKIIAEAQVAAQRERDKSLAEIRAAKEGALREMAEKSVDTAFALAGRVLHKEIRPADHTALIAESLAKFPSQN